MPIYNARCSKCEKLEDYYQTIAERHHTPLCCGAGMEKVITKAAAVFGDLPDYTSPIDGRWISGKRQRTEDFKRNDARPWEGLAAEKKEAARRERYIEAKNEAHLDKSVNEAYYQLPPEKREILKGA